MQFDAGFTGILAAPFPETTHVERQAKPLSTLQCPNWSARPVVCRRSKPPEMTPGADTVYFGYKNDTNARNFAGLNFDHKAMLEGVAYAHARGRHVLVAINTFPQPGREADWHAAKLVGAAELGVDVDLADVGLLDYASRRHPDLRRHLSVQGSATSYEAVNFAHREFGIRRAVLPRVLTLTQVEGVIRNTPVEIEVFGFGSLCVMNEGRCWLSSYATGESPNTVGRLLAGQVCEVGPSAGAHGYASQRYSDRPLR